MKITSIIAWRVNGLVGVFCLTFTLIAAEPGTVLQNATVFNNVGKGKPVIQFETNFFDFGKLIAPGSVSGVFKFKNAGDGILKVDPPVPSCGCTDAKVKPSTLAPGESGEITYTIKLDHAMQVQKHIMVYSSDPKTPEVQLTMQMDYTPLYELNPDMLRLLMPLGKNEAQGTFMVVRNDGKPLGIERLVTSQKWVSAVWDPSFKAEANSDRIIVTVHRPPHPASIVVASVELWDSNHTDRPMQTLLISCQMQGELSATPSQMYWVIPDFGNSLTSYSAASLTRTVELKSTSDKPVKITNVTTSITDMGVRIVSKDDGKAFDLILKFDELPQGFMSGNVTVETSSPSLPKLEIPLTISVAPK